MFKWPRGEVVKHDGLQNRYPRVQIPPWPLYERRLQFIFSQALLLFLAEYIDVSGRIVATDVSSEMLKLAKRRARRFQNARIEFQKIAAKIILQQCYYENCLALERKSQSARRCLQSGIGGERYGTMISPGVGTGRRSRLKTA